VLVHILGRLLFCPENLPQPKIFWGKKENDTFKKYFFLIFLIVLILIFRKLFIKISAFTNVCKRFLIFNFQKRF